MYSTQVMSVPSYRRAPIASLLGLRCPPWVTVAALALAAFAGRRPAPAPPPLAVVPRAIPVIYAPVIVRAPTTAELRADTIAHMLVRKHVDPTNATRWARTFVHYGEQLHVNPKLLVAIAYAESEFKPTARSSAGAIGLMQVVPSRASWGELEGRCGRMTVHNLRNPRVNICFGSHIFRSFLDAHHGDSDRALSAYNNGTGEPNGYADRVYASLASLRPRRGGR